MGLTHPTASGRGATRARVRIAWAVLAALAVLALVDAWLWQRTLAWNAVIAGVQAAPAQQIGPPEVRLAQAHALATGGDDEAALKAYRVLHGDTPVGQAARFNTGNLLIRQALELRAGLQPGQAIALIELAKETYRDVLRVDPQHWDARYNLERAQRLLPDPEPEDLTPAEPPPDAENAPTTVRGVSRGLP